MVTSGFKVKPESEYEFAINYPGSNNSNNTGSGLYPPGEVYGTYGCLGPSLEVTPNLYLHHILGALGTSDVPCSSCLSCFTSLCSLSSSSLSSASESTSWSHLEPSHVPWGRGSHDTNVLHELSDRVQWFSPASWLCRQIHQAAVLTRLRSLEAPFHRGVLPQHTSHLRASLASNLAA